MKLKNRIVIHKNLFGHDYIRGILFTDVLYH